MPTKSKSQGITKKVAKEIASTKHSDIKETFIQRASNFINEDMDDNGYMDALKGGEAEGKTIEDIADKHNVPVEYLEFIMPDAIEIEMEHTDDPEVAGRIALDHLWETPLYYDDKLGLPEMEEELEDMEDEEIQDIVKKVLKYGEIDKDVEEEHKEAVKDVKENLNLNELFKVKKPNDFLLESSNKKLTDFVGTPGDTEIWYEKEICFDGWDFREEMYAEEPEHNYEYTKRNGPRIDPKNLEKTHALLGTVGETDLDEIYHMMNTWGIGELSNKFLEEKGVSHTSMSIGDIIKIGDTVWFVDRRGFKDITNE